MMPEHLRIFGFEMHLYYLGYILSFPICFWFNFFYYRKKYKLNSFRVIGLSLLGMNICYVALLILSSALQGTIVHGMNWVRAIGFVPLFLIPLALLSKTKITTSLDFFAPTLGFANVWAHLGCIFAGCCYGYPIEQYPQWLQWMGIYNNVYSRYLFPIQLVECVCYGICGLIVVLWAKSRHFDTKGYAFPFYLILFGIARFFCEYGRDNEKIAGNLSEFSFWCIAWIVLGIVWIILGMRYNKKHQLEKAIEPDDLPSDTTKTNTNISEANNEKISNTYTV